MSDIDTAAADSLKVLDPERPIREADIAEPATGSTRSLVTRMYDPAVRSKKISTAGGRRSCINVSGLLLEAVLRAIMVISAPAISLADRPHIWPLGSPVFACAGETEPPSRLIFSQTLAGKSNSIL